MLTKEAEQQITRALAEFMKRRAKLTRDEKLRAKTLKMNLRTILRYGDRW